LLTVVNALTYNWSYIFLQHLLMLDWKKNSITLYFKLSVLQCNYTFKYWVLIMYAL